MTIIYVNHLLKRANKSKKRQIRLNISVKITFLHTIHSVVDRHRFHADPNPAFYLNADPDPHPALHFNANADPDRDPAPLQNDGNLQPLDYRPSGAPF